MKEVKFIIEIVYDDKTDITSSDIESRLNEIFFNINSEYSQVISHVKITEFDENENNVKSLMDIIQAYSREQIKKHKQIEKMISDWFKSQVYS